MGEKDADALWRAVDESRAVLRRRLRWVGGAGSVEDERRFIAAASRQGGRVTWGIFEAESERLAGVASLDRGAADSRAQARFAIWIRADRQDRGYSTEAGRAMLGYAFRRLGCHRVFVRLAPANRAFRRVLKKLGFCYEGCLRDDKRLNGRWVDQECWGLLRTEWKK